jgi:tripartite-type tricarboxylate transporter receptor subunit TctC
MKQLFIIGAILCAVLSAHANTVIPVVWGFSLSSTQGQMVQEIINHANSDQKEFYFLLTHRPGAGGAVAVHYVNSLSRPAILAHTSSFFIRPYMNNQGSYDPEQYVLLNNYCSDQPLALISNRYKTLKELNDANSINVGILPGSITQLVVEQYHRQQVSKDMVKIGFSGTPEITASLLGNHIDLGVDWLAGITHSNLNVLAITGTHNYKNAKTFRSQGINGFDNITNSYYLLMNRHTPADLVDKFNKIMSTAVESNRVKNYCSRDFGQPTNVSGANAQLLFVQVHQYWKKLVSEIIK